jgi:hypothetical protein
MVTAFMIGICGVLCEGCEPRRREDAKSEIEQKKTKRLSRISLENEFHRDTQRTKGGFHREISIVHPP